MLYVTIQSLQQQNVFSDIQIRKYILKRHAPAGTKCKPAFCIYAQTKAQISCAANAQLISALLRYIEQFHYNLYPNFKPLTIFCGYATRFVSDLVRKSEDRCCLYNVLFKQPLVIFTGDTPGHTMFSIISPI